VWNLLKKISAERFAGAIFVLIGTFSIVESFRLRPMRVRGVVGDDTLPLIIGIILLSLGMIQTFVVKAPSTKVVFPKGKVARRVIGSMSILFAYWACLSYLGYMISTFLCSMTLFKLFSNYHWYTILIASVLLTFSMNVIFIYFLKMPFPIGVLRI
jgi:putative tricarboxylic transport membrane protein